MHHIPLASFLPRDVNILLTQQLLCAVKGEPGSQLAHILIETSSCQWRNGRWVVTCDVHGAVGSSAGH